MGVSPSSGAAGTLVTITGTGFLGATDVDFGTQAAIGWRVNAAGTELITTAPPPAAGTETGAVNVVVTGPDGASNNGSFTYLPAEFPHLSALSPSTGPNAGGTEIEITGTDFTPDAVVRFYKPSDAPDPSSGFITGQSGQRLSPQVRYSGPTSLTAQSPPAETAGFAHVAVDARAGSSEVLQTSTSNGTGNLTVVSVKGFRTFAAVYGTGATPDVFRYRIDIAGLAAFEVGTGHMSNTTTFVRDTVIESSNGNMHVNWINSVQKYIRAIPTDTDFQYVAAPPVIS